MLYLLFYDMIQCLINLRYPYFKKGFLCYNRDSDIREYILAMFLIYGKISVLYFSDIEKNATTFLRRIFRVLDNKT